jgi:hypothetical protein
MDSRDIPSVVLGFFIMAILMVFVPVFSKAYKNWKD